VIFCCSYLLTAFPQSPRLPYPLNWVTVCDKPVAVISPITRHRSREAANNTRACPRPPVADGSNQVRCHSSAPKSQPLQSTDSHAQAHAAMAAATQERWQRPQSDPNTVHSMHKPVGVISLYSPPSVPWSRNWHRSPPQPPEGNRLSRFRFAFSYWAAPWTQQRTDSNVQAPTPTATTHEWSVWLT